MIKDITIQRVDSANSINDPIQISENSQLAINNNNQLTILDPKLPLLHRSIKVINEKKALEPKELYTVSSILFPEALETLPLRNFSRVFVESLDENFSFGGINEPIITAHKWSPVNPYSKDCFLGVLFNTNELLIFERANSQPEQYSVKYNLFQHLVSDIGCVSESDQEVIVDRAGLDKLKIESFDFTLIEVFGEPTVVLSTIAKEGSLKVYRLDENNLHLIGSAELGMSVSKQSWSQWRNEGGKYIAHLALAFNDNSVGYCDITLNGPHMLSILEIHSLRRKSRFWVSQVKWISSNDTDILITCSTGSLAVSLLTVRKNPTSSIQKLPDLSLITGIIETYEEKSLQITLAFESGRFDSWYYEIDKAAFAPTAAPPQLPNFVARNLYKYQLTFSSHEGQDLKTEDETPFLGGTKTNSDLTRPFLSHSVEGDFVMYGTSKMGDILCILYKIIPRNILNYTILSKSELQVGFIRISHSINKNSALNTRSTSLQFLNQFLFSNFQELPQFPKLSGDVQLEILKFATSMLNFKKSYFNEVENIDVYSFHADFPSLQGYLMKHFIDNYNIKQLQNIFNFNLAIQDTFKFFKKFNNKDSDALESYILNEQNLILDKVKRHLSLTILNFLQNKRIYNEFDKFLVISHYLFLQGANLGEEDFKEKIPNSAAISIGTRFFTEHFDISVDDMKTEADSLIKSTSNHLWLTCNLTLFPLMEMNNKIDELRRFNYIYEIPSQSDIEYAKDLLRSIRYCIVTGNRIYPFN